MKATGLSILFLGALGGALACADTPPVAPEVSPALAAQSSNEEDTPPEGVPEELTFPTQLYGVSANVGWSDNHAWGEAWVSYFATNALARATLTTDFGSSTGESEVGDALPWNREITAHTEV